MQDTVTKDRERFIGGSDIPSIMGISPFTKRFDMLKYKAQIKVNEFEGNAYTEYGNEMEPKIRDYINSLGYSFHEAKKILADSEVLPTRYHADGLDDDGIVLEIKTTSKIGTLEDYKHYLVQLLYGMYVNECDNGVLAVYERPKDMSLEFDKNRLQIYCIGMEDFESLMKDILEAVQSFRDDFVYLSENPFANEDELPSNSALKTISERKMEIGGVKFPVSWLLEHLKDLSDAEKALKAEIKAQMEQHKVKKVEFADLGVRFSYIEGSSGKQTMKFDEAAFREENEDLYEDYLRPVTTGRKSSSVRVTAMAKGEKA